MLKKIAIAFLLCHLAGCTPDKGRTYRVHKEVVTCMGYEVDDCGVMLYRCSNGIGYRCLHDVEVYQ